MKINAQAEALNKLLAEKNQAIPEMLSDKGKAIFFPKLGILAQAADAKGKKINASIGIALEEDGTPMRLNSIAKNIPLNPKDVFPYAPGFGKPELREKWKELMLKKNPSISSEISSPVATAALTHALRMAGYMFINPGDKIITPNLFWGNYKLIFQHSYAAEFAEFDMFKEGKFNTNGLKENLTEGKNIIILNFPNNPSGYTPSEAEVDETVSILKEHAEKGNKIVAIIDDAYFGLIYKDGIFKESIFSKLCNLHENILAVKIDGATKEDYVWGFRIGFITFGCKGMDKEGYAALEQKAAGAVRGSISNAPHISQSLVLNAFASETYDAEKKEKYNILKERCEEVEKTLASHPEYREEYEPLPFNSGYFMCIKTKKDAEKIRQVLLQKYDTGLISFGGSIIRIAFSSVKKSDIAELYDNIYKASKEV